jgi:Protein of unknown function (DUF1573)
MEDQFIPAPGVRHVPLPRPGSLRDTAARQRPEARRSRRLDGRVFVFALALAAFLLAPQIVLFASTPLLPLRAQIGIGTVHPGERIRREFVLANLSLRPVTILSVTGGCGCVANVTGSPRLGRFTSKTIVASFVAKGPTGLLQREIQVETDDPRRPYLTLRLEGRVAPAAASDGDKKRSS